MNRGKALEKKLLLLGLLQSHEMHGYRINELLENSCAIPVKLKKANAYKLLADMEKQGWVTHKTEKEGNRPPRRVYSVTSKGSKAFLRLLRENLSSLGKPEFSGLIGLDFAGFLQGKETASLLSEKLSLLEKHFRELDGIPESVRKAHPSIDYMHRYYSAEIIWITEVIKRLGS